jgi:hypothetical protein
MCDVLFTSSILNGYLAGLNKTDRKGMVKEGYGGKNMIDVLRKLSLLPLMFFPDEIIKPVPYIKVKLAENEKLSLLVEMKSKQMGVNAPPEGCQLATTFAVGEVSRTYKLPYFGDLSTA